MHARTHTMKYAHVPWEAILSKALQMLYSAYSLESHVTLRKILQYIPGCRDVLRYFPGGHMTPREKNHCKRVNTLHVPVHFAKVSRGQNSLPEGVPI